MRAFLPFVLAALTFAQGDPDGALRYMAGLASKGLAQELRVEAEQFLKDFPGHPREAEARYRLGAALSELDKSAEAVQVLAPLAKLAKFEFAAEAAFRQGQCELRLGRPAEAAAALERALSFGKPNLELPARTLLGDACLGAGRLADAQAAYARVLEREPDGAHAADAACGLCWCAHRAKQYDAVLELGGRFLTRFPRHARAGEAQFLRSEALFELGRFEEALASYQRVPSGADAEFGDAALRGAAFALAALERHAEASTAFAALLERYPKSRFLDEARLQVGVEKLLAGDARGALASLPENGAGRAGEGAYWRARALAAAGDERAALELCGRAANSGANEELSRRWASLRADLLAKSGRAQEAREAYEAADTDYALQAGAVASLQAGEPAEALRLARKLLERNPKTIYRREALLSAAEALLALGDHGAAEHGFLEAATSDSDAARAERARLRAAWCRYLGGDPKSAAPMFRELARKASDPAVLDEANYMQARASEDAGDVAGARAAYAQYVQRFAQGSRRSDALIGVARLTEGPEATAQLESILSGLGEGEEALRVRFEVAERCSKAGEFARAAPHYAAILKAKAPTELAESARYGLAWCQFQGSQPADCLRTLSPWLGAEGRGARGAPPARLADAVLELSVWAAVRSGELDGAERQLALFAASCEDDARVWAAARTVLDASAAKGGAASDARVLERRAALVERLGARAKSPEVRGEIEAERASLALAAGDRAGALQRLDSAWRLAPGSAAVREAACSTAEASLAAKDLEAGEGILEAVARDERAPCADRAVYRLGHWRLSNGDARAAAKQLARFQERFPGSSLALPARFLEAEALLRSGDEARALKSFESLCSEECGDELAPKVLFRAGVLHCKAGRFDAGERELAALLEHFAAFENAPEARLWLARARLARGGEAARPGALRALEELAASDKGWIGAEAQLSLGESALDSGDAEGALRRYLRVAVLFSDAELVARSNLGAGAALERLGRKEEAAARYREILERAGEHPLAARAKERLSALAAR